MTAVMEEAPPVAEAEIVRENAAVAVRSPMNLAKSIPAKLEYARALADSGLLPAQFRRQPGNVLYAVEYGEMLGLSPMAAITGIHVIEGKPSASAGLISALVRRAGHKLRVKGNAKSATCQITRCDDPDYVFEVTWTLKRNADDNPSAEEAQLLGKQVWKNYPASMLKSRAITQCARDACEEALFGLHYTAEELGAEVDEDGNILIAEIVEDAAVTDWEWLERATARVPKMETRGELAGLWAESASMVGAGKCAQADAAALQSLLRQRMTEVDAVARSAAETVPQPSPAPAAEAVGDDDEWALRIRDIATLEEADQVRGELVAEFGGRMDSDPRAAVLQDALDQRTAGLACPEGLMVDGDLRRCVKTGGHAFREDGSFHDDGTGRQWAAPGDPAESPEDRWVRAFVARIPGADETAIRSMRIEVSKAVTAKTVSPQIANELGTALTDRAKGLKRK